MTTVERLEELKTVDIKEIAQVQGFDFRAG